MTTQRCILVADKVSTAVLETKMVTNGLWSVPRWKGRPYSSSSGHQIQFPRLPFIFASNSFQSSRLFSKQFQWDAILFHLKSQLQHRRRRHHMPESAYSFHHMSQTPCQPQAHICWAQTPLYTLLSRPTSLLSGTADARAAVPWIGRVWNQSCWTQFHQTS